MKRIFLIIAVTCAALIPSACDYGPKSSRGFTLPDGKVSAGEKVFARLRCGDCHLIVGREDLRAGIDPEMNLRIGGRTPRIRTYGELVTSIINPSHVISKTFPGAQVSEGGRSKMPNYNYTMTVNELIDLVAFLQMQYELDPFVPTDYRNYGIAPSL